MSTAYKCAVVLRDLISPYLLRRRKMDIQAELPEKTEQVLLHTSCSSTRLVPDGRTCVLVQPGRCVFEARLRHPRSRAHTANALGVTLHLHFCLPQVLFCRLSPEQRELYRAYLASKDVEAILAGDRNALAGIDVLRKICNHPDLLQVRHTLQVVALAHTSARRWEYAQDCHCRQSVPPAAYRPSAPTFACLWLPVSV